MPSRINLRPRATPPHVKPGQEVVYLDQGGELQSVDDQGVVTPVGSGEGGSGVTVDNQDDPPADITTLIAAGATISGDEATIVGGGSVIVSGDTDALFGTSLQSEDGDAYADNVALSTGDGAAVTDINSSTQGSGDASAGQLAETEGSGTAYAGATAEASGGGDASTLATSETSDTGTAISGIKATSQVPSSPVEASVVVEALADQATLTALGTDMAFTATNDIELTASNDITLSVLNLLEMIGLVQFTSGLVFMLDMPTVDPMTLGQLWVDPADGFTLKVSQGV